MNVTPGTRLWATSSPVAVIVTRAPTAPVEITCDGVPMAAADPAPAAATGDGLTLGKRYVDDESGTELLCTRAGAGVVAVDGRPAVLAGARALPASD
jgi:hypothetical protein